VDFDDTPAEVAFRARARAWLEEHVAPEYRAESGADELADVDRATYGAECRAWQRRLLDGGWAGLA